jgi:hypothetical protein
VALVTVTSAAPAYSAVVLIRRGADGVGVSATRVAGIFPSGKGDLGRGGCHASLGLGTDHRAARAAADGRRVRASLELIEQIQPKACGNSGRRLLWQWPGQTDVDVAAEDGFGWRLPARAGFRAASSRQH